MSESQYKIWFPTSQVLLPAIGTLYFLISLQYDLPNEVNVLGGLMVLKLITATYFWSKNRKSDGKIIITQDKRGVKTFSLELYKDPDELENMRRVSFKIVPQDYDRPAVINIRPKDEGPAE